MSPPRREPEIERPSGGGPARVKLFEPFCEGIFANRPSRFLCRVEAAGRIRSVHCPNPGRMLELLVPGVRVILERAGSGAGRSQTVRRKTDCTLAAVYHRDRVVPLVSARANLAARALVLPRLFPEALEIQREAGYRGSRFDFRLRLPEETLLLEVKSCTLVEHRTALFPDAPTERGSRHLDHLQRFAAEGGRAGVLFLIMQPDAEVFMPNIHTDPVFSGKLMEYRQQLSLFASCIRCNSRGEAILHRLSVPVDFGRTERHLADRGCYLLLLELRQGTNLEAGSLGTLRLRKGFYIYAGSAKRNLEARLRRHRRRRKRTFWHIDHLSRQADRITDLPIRTSRSLECSLARSLAELGYPGVSGFGCSDCSCGSHLFYSEKPPLSDRRFLELLNRYRHREALL